MKKILLILIPILLIVGGVGYWYWTSRSSSSVSPKAQHISPTDIPLKLLEDEWGLRVHYPEDLTVVTATKSGELTRYTFTNTSHAGSIDVYSKQSSAEDVDAWVKSDKHAATSSGNLDTTLGGQDAKKLRYTGSADLDVVALNTGQVFIFSMHPGDGEEKYWNQTFDTLVSKFEFLPFEGETLQPADDSASAPAGDDSSVSDTEEVIQ